MELLGIDWSRIHENKTFGFWSLLLAILSVPYNLGNRFRLWSYKKGLFKKRSLPGIVVSIGNLTVGGTGKTPAVAMLAKWASDKGYRVAILSRGYGGKYKDKVFEVTDGSSIKANPRKTGDESYLLAKKLSGIPLVISKRRYLAGLLAHIKFDCNFFILDDGFQHLELKRDLDLVLIDAKNAFGNGHLLPWGPLREPLSQLRRADVFIITRVSSSGPGDAVPSFLKKEFPSIPVFYADHLPSEIVFPSINKVHKPAFIKGKAVLGFAGIARPDQFKDTLVRLGAEVVYFKGFKDHYQFSGEDILNLIHMKEKTGAQYLLTTEKDWIRISSLGLVCHDMAYLCVEFVLLSEPKKFFSMITDDILKQRV